MELELVCRLATCIFLLTALYVAVTRSLTANEDDYNDDP